MTPQRIQLSRKKGFNLQEYSRRLNGLPAKKCDRSTKFGNPFRVVEHDKFWSIKSYGSDLVSSIIIENNRFCYGSKESAVEDALKLFEEYIKWGRIDFNQLKGYNLACWCKPDEECHCDIILEKLNQQQ